MSVILQTSIGNIVVDLDVQNAQKESQNFIKLCKAKYFNFTPFYNVQSGFIAEAGAPLYPNSKEGQSVWHLAGQSSQKEFIANPNQSSSNTKGALSYIPHIFDNQRHVSSLFSITLATIDPSIKALAANIVFGHVVEGLDVLDKLNQIIVDANHRPLQDVRIHHTYILHDPFEDIEGLEIPINSPEISEAQISTIRLNDIEEFNLESEEDLDEEELKRKQQMEIDSRAITLELIGDLPSAEVKPLENVLFVCKLNPLTKSDDLQIIFSRFGKIVSCEVIRDAKTNESLQYAFIEFDNKKSCENAYFKMDEVLIDDRRIHVDFSQSVTKLSEAWRQQSSKKVKSNILGNSTGKVGTAYNNRQFKKQNFGKGDNSNVKRLKWSKS